MKNLMRILSLCILLSGLFGFMNFARATRVADTAQVADAARVADATQVADAARDLRAADFTFSHPLLLNFAKELEKIKADRPECLSTAAEKYETFFKGQPEALCDSAFLLLEDYAAYSILNVDFNLPLSYETNSHAGEKYRNNLAKNYFIIKDEDNDLRVEADLNALQNRMSAYLSPAVNAFFAQVKKENENGNHTAELTPEELAARACFWDDYLNLYPQSLYAGEVPERRDACLDILIFGSEKYPVFNGKGVLNTNYRKVFERLNTEFSKGINTKTRQTVYDFWRILKENGFKDSPEVWLFTF